VLGANDGLISTSSLVVGVAAANAEKMSLLLSACAGCVAGALSMAAGEYVSVSSQADGEAAELDLERRELAASPEHELAELTGIYVERGLPKDLARTVAEALMAHDALGAHARDELGLTESTRARPFQAAWASAVAFACGAAAPVTLVALLPVGAVIGVVTLVTLGLLAVLGSLAAKLGGASMIKGALRVLIWGALAMGVSQLVGLAFDLHA
jgi:VIT1/CCC1 family predicted Fe2+/Mn2+ transporter